MNRFLNYLFPLLLLAKPGFSQSRNEVGPESVSNFKVKRYYSGDTLLIKCDTLFLMNPVTFRFYDDLYRKSPQIQNAVHDFGLRYEEEIAQCETENLKLQEEFSGLVRNFENYRIQAEIIQLQLKTNLDQSVMNLESMNQQLKDFQKQLKKQAWRSIGGRILWATGGFCAGMIVMGLLD